MVAARSRVSARNTARLISATWRSKVRIVPMHPSTLVSWWGGWDLWVKEHIAFLHVYCLLFEPTQDVNGTVANDAIQLE